MSFERVINNYKSSVRYLTYRGMAWNCTREEQYQNVEFSYQKEELIRKCVEKEITNNHNSELKA